MPIFYEKRHVLGLLNGEKKNKRLFQHEINLIACYLRNDLGKSREQVKGDLIDFLEENNDDYNIVRGRLRINKALEKSDYRKLRDIESIPVTKREVDVIYENFDEYKRQKAVFTAIVLSKFYYDKSHYKNYERNKKYENWYILYNDMSQILSLAGVHASVEERYKIIYELNQSGLVTYHIGRNGGFYKINCIDLENDDVFVLVDDLDNIGDFFPHLCINCGNKYEWTPYGKNQLCDECYKKKLRKDVRENVAKFRKRNGEKS